MNWSKKRTETCKSQWTELQNSETKDCNLSVSTKYNPFDYITSFISQKEVFSYVLDWDVDVEVELRDARQVGSDPNKRRSTWKEVSVKLLLEE
jgi:hypothetical protein